MLLKTVLLVICNPSFIQCLLSNVSRIQQEFPSIREGEPCVKGKIYKMSCNTCHCAENNALYCTKMACLNSEDIIRLNMIKKRSPSLSLRTRDNKKENTETDPYLPNLTNNLCVPGKLYRNGCKKCYCDNEGKPVCNLSKVSGCKEFPKLLDISSPTDVSPPITKEQFWRLPMLPNTAAKCEPGKLYLVDCNTCLCLDNGNLFCEKLLCLNQDEENTAKAKKWSGSPCKKGDDTLSTRCIRCSCVNGATKCYPVLGCVMPKVQKLHGNSKIRLNLEEDCEPGAIYKIDCNKCYCQSDLSLRCTQKSCLNYRQALKLVKQRTFLEKHGL